MISPTITPITRWGLNLLGVLAAVMVLRLGQAIFIPTVIALILAAVLWPGAVSLHRQLKMPWSVACLTALTGLLLLNVVVTLGFTFSIARLLQNMPNPNSADGQQRLYTKIRDKVEVISPVALDDDDPYWPKQAEDSRVFQYVQETIQKNMAYGLLRVAEYGNSWIWQWVLIMFLLLFLLVEGKMLTRRTVEILGTSADTQQKAGAALTDMALQVRSFIVWRTLINILLGMVLWVFYYSLGLTEWFTWGLLAMVLCYVPYLGPIAAGIPPIIDAFLSCPTPFYAVIVMAAYAVLITVEGYIIVPVVMGRSMEMNATTVMLACLFWDLVWGLPGLFMAMPLMAAIKAVCHHVPELRPWANLMSISEGADVRPSSQMNIHIDAEFGPNLPPDPEPTTPPAEESHTTPVG